jgi:hypothetical protein
MIWMTRILANVTNLTKVVSNAIDSSGMLVNPDEVSELRELCAKSAKNTQIGAPVLSVVHEGGRGGYVCVMVPNTGSPTANYIAAMKRIS